MTTQEALSWLMANAQGYEWSAESPTKCLIAWREGRYLFTTYSDHADVPVAFIECVVRMKSVVEGRLA